MTHLPVASIALLHTGLTSWTATLQPAEWLNASEVSALFVQAGLFRVPRSTLYRWTLAGRITAVRTAGGHRRYRGTEVRALIAAALAEAT